MILAVLFMLAGAGAFIAGFAQLTAGNFQPAAFVVAAPFFGSALVMFGLAQLINLAIRMTKAAERTAALLEERLPK